MPDITRESLLLREDLMTLVALAEEEWPRRVPALESAFRRAVRVDTGIAAAVLLVRSGASEEETDALRRCRDARRKRRAA